MMSARNLSRRTLLGAFAATPAASVPLPLANSPSPEWRAAVQAWRDAETMIALAHARFDAAERFWFAMRKNSPDGRASAAELGLERASRDHDRQLDLHDDALDALLNTRGPDVSAIVWKLGLVRTMLGSDWPDLLDFLPADIRALGGDRHAQRDSRKEARHVDR